MSASLPVSTLADAQVGQAHRVQTLEAPSYAPEWKQWLEELGFVPGEHVAVLARAMPGHDPLVVRIGQSGTQRVGERICQRISQWISERSLSCMRPSSTCIPRGRCWRWSATPTAARPRCSTA